LDKFRQAAEIFENVAENYPYTESEIGAYSNMGMCYEELGQWQKAADAYDMVIQRFEEGADVAQDAYSFAQQHKDWIVANQL
jgi:TolA-binding protein